MNRAFASNAQVRVMVDRDDLKARLDGFKAEWVEITEGEMQAVKVDLDLFFDDLTVLLGLGESNGEGDRHVA